MIFFRFLAKLVGLGRALTGAYFLAEPATGAEMWTGSRRYPSPEIVRSVAVRDLMIGGALMTSGRTLRGWLAAGIAADLADLAGALASDKMPREKQRLVVLLAGGWAVLGTIAWLGAGEPRRKVKARELSLEAEDTREPRPIPLPA